MQQSQFLSKYDHNTIESKWLKNYEASNSFDPHNSLNLQNISAANSYSIVIPPPNVTGELHVGHALNQTIQDVLIRDARKRSQNALWIPGTDHAGIATQVRVEKQLQKENINRHDIGRDAFLKKVWEWKEKYGDRIVEQQKLMGFSADWSRLAFTMSPELNETVKDVFVTLYDAGYIYKNRSIVQWDPVARTVLSSLEIEYDEEHIGELYFFAYPLAQTNEKNETNQNDKITEIVVATTRPETILGDTAVAVHPDDERYKSLIGKKLRHPLLPREISIIADPDLVDPEFGSGAVKITPAHDVNDFAVGLRHGLPSIHIFDDTAHMNEKCGEFQGLDRFVAREKIKEKLLQLGLFRDAKRHKIPLARSQRSGAILEPLVSTQWFVKMKPLAADAIKVVEEGKIRFFPKKWEKTYFHWMHNIHDWCISRQLWWGHQIPAWYGPDGEIFVAKNIEQAQNKAYEHYKKEVVLRQDEDVLDTWFSSALWPFSTLGWNLDKSSEDFKTYFPTAVLVTGFDIIFFWVARMIMMSLFFTKEIPFKDIYIHNLMRDPSGKKMSKTLGNVIDPIETIKDSSADAFRFFLLATLNEGKDSIYSEQQLRGYQNFMNKIWNATRFLCMHLPENFEPVSTHFSTKNSSSQKIAELQKTLQLESEDSWILHRLDECIKNAKMHLEQYKFQMYAKSLYTFVWHEYCDWYVEAIKPRLFHKPGAAAPETAAHIAFFVLETILHYLHPSIPFITEELHSYLAEYTKKKDMYLCNTAYPHPLQFSTYKFEDAKNFQIIQELVIGIRSVRTELNLSPSQPLRIFLFLSDQALAEFLRSKETIFIKLAKVEKMELILGSQEEEHIATLMKKERCIAKSFSNMQLYVAVGDLIDFDSEEKKIILKIQESEQQIRSVTQQLENKKFIDRAPEKVISQHKIKLEELEMRKEKLSKTLALYKEVTFSA